MLERPHEERVDRYADACSVLDDRDYLVPEVQPTGAGRLDRFRASVSRFCNGADHDRRRALLEADLARIDPGSLERAAHARTRAELGRASPQTPDPVERTARLARAVPVATLAASLGIAEDRLGDAVEAVTAIAGAYLPGSNPDAEALRRADRGVDRLLGLLAPAREEELANRACLLVQACDATARLVVGAFERAVPLAADPERWPVSAIVAETLRCDPPARVMRRERRDGGAAVPVLIDVAAANRDPDVFAEPDRFDPGRPDARHLAFGYGPRACPGAEHAAALARGVVTALLAESHPSRSCAAARQEG